MIVADAVTDKDEADAVVLAGPSLTIAARPDLPGLVHFRVGVGFVLAFAPSPTPKETEPIGEGLFEISAESVFNRGLKRMIGDFGNRGGGICPPGIHRIAIVAHVGMVDVAEQTKHARGMAL